MDIQRTEKLRNDSRLSSLACRVQSNSDNWFWLAIPPYDSEKEIVVPQVTGPLWTLINPLVIVGKLYSGVSKSPEYPSQSSVLLTVLKQIVATAPPPVVHVVPPQSKYESLFSYIDDNGRIWQMVLPNILH